MTLERAHRKASHMDRSERNDLKWVIRHIPHPTSMTSKVDGRLNSPSRTDNGPQIRHVSIRISSRAYPIILYRAPTISLTIRGLQCTKSSLLSLFGYRTRRDPPPHLLRVHFSPMDLTLWSPSMSSPCLSVTRARARPLLLAPCTLNAHSPFSITKAKLYVSNSPIMYAYCTK